jgi:hypothetical protein
LKRKAEKMSSEAAMLEAALNYSRLGMIVHPLLNPNAPEIDPKTGKEQSPGKGVLVKAWQKRESALTEAEIKKYWGPNRSITSRMQTLACNVGKDQVLP